VFHFTPPMGVGGVEQSVVCEWVCVNTFTSPE